jgi:apolipoprotein N-acyltransferase
LVACLALAAGVVHALSFAPAGLPWLELACLAVVFALGASATRPAAAFGIGFAFGLGWLGLGLSWIYISLHHYGGLWAPLAALAVALLAAGLALLPAIALAAAAACGAPRSARRAVASVAAWTLADWLRGIVFTGMPWLATGYAHTDGPLAGYAPVAGVYGVGLAAAAVAAASVWGCMAAWSWRRTPVRAATRGVGVAAFIALVLLGGAALRRPAWSEDAGPPVRVRLVQGNIAQDTKFGTGGLDVAVARYLPALADPRAADKPERAASDPALAPAPGSARDSAPISLPDRPAPDLIVLPESAFPLPVNDLPEDLLGQIMDPRARGGAALIFGAFIVEPGQRYFNSAIGLGNASLAPQRYSKRHLVPFGEFVPYGFHWFVAMLDMPIGDQERGERFQSPMALAGERIAVSICFEDLFGERIRDAWHDPAQEPTVLLNLSNLAWFDDSSALPQHLQIERMRALETARPLISDTNTGITALIDARANVVAQLPLQVPPHATQVLEGSVQGKRGTTPYIRWGDAPVWAGAMLVILLCALLPRRNLDTSALPTAPKT